MAEYNNPVPNTPRNRGDYDAPHMSPVLPSEDLRTILINRVSWGSVFSGVALALVTQFLLNLFGVGIGLTTLNSYGVADTNTMSIGALGWWAVSGIIAAAIGGYTAGRLCGEPRESTAAWHGLTSWAVSTLVVSLMIIGGAGALLGGTLQVTGVGGTISVRNNLAVTQPGPAGMTTNGVNNAYNNDVNATDTTGATTTDTTTTTGTTARNATIGNGVATVDATTMSRGALACTVALLLGAIAAWFGGYVGAVEPTITAFSGNQRRQLH